MKISERLEFLTQIHTSWNNTEQRAGLRYYPRRSVNYEYIGMSDEQSQYLRAQTYTQQTTQIQVPLWHASYRIPYIIYKDSYDITIPTDRLWQYRGAQSVILWFNDKFGGYQNSIKAIYANGLIKLKKPIKDKYPPGTITIMPYSNAILSSEDKFTNSNSILSSMELDYELMQDYTTIPIPANYDENHYEPCKDFDKWRSPQLSTYNNLDVFMVPPAWTNDMQVNYKRNANRLDSNYGYFRYDLKSSNPIETKELEYTATSISEINNFQRFFCRCKGKLKAFYAPTWVSDLELVRDSLPGQNYLIVKFPYYWKYYSSGQRRKTLILFTRSFDTRIIQVAAYSLDDTGELGKVYLESPLTTPILLKDTLMVSFFCKYRLDNDALVTNFETVEIASLSSSMTEVDA